MAPDHKTLDIEEIAAEQSADKAIFSYVGIFDQDATDQLIIGVDNFLNIRDYSNALRKRTFHIVVEVVQNLFKYLSKKRRESNFNKGLFLMHGNAEKVIITSGNYILKSEENSLKSRITLINSLTNDELVHFYRGLLDVGSITSQGGAGLGFVDIAKKSGGKIQYEFKDIDDEYSFYLFKIIISN